MDKISEMLTKIRNAQAAGHSEVLVSFSKIKLAMVDILKKEGYVLDFNQEKDGAIIRIKLKYQMVSQTDKLPAIQGIRKVSRSGQRVYVKSKDVKKVKNNFGTAIFSTSRGIMTGEDAKKIGLGGEYICEVW